MRFTVKAPASSANLGPGFDCLGIALDLWNDVTIDTEGEPGAISQTGPEARPIAERDNLTLEAMRLVAQECGESLPPFSMEACTGVPVSRGLGSSAAALIAGLVAGNHLLGDPCTREDLYALAWRMEGHGDNVGAALYGGAVLAVPGVHHVERLWDGQCDDLTTVVYIPEATGATYAARAALPPYLPHADATFNVARAAGMALGLRTGSHELIAASMIDRLHEPYRARLFTHLDPMKAAAKEAGALGASLSGAGPSMLAFVHPAQADCVVAALTETARELNVHGRALHLPPVSSGVVIDTP